MVMWRVEAAVIGGGPAGCAAALALRARGMDDVALVERSCYETPRIGETLPPAIQCELVSLGVWDEFLTAGHLRSPGIRCVWGSAEPYERSHLFDPYGPGWHVDRRAFDAALADAAASRGVLVLLGHRLVDIARAGSDEWRVRIASGTGEVTIAAQIVIDATGRTAAVGRRLGAERRSTDRLVALFHFFHDAAATPAESPTMIEAVGDGWWYTAPLPGRRVVAALMTDADLDTRTLLRDVIGWTSRLRSAPFTRVRIADCAPEKPPRLAGAGSGRLAPTGGDGWLAIGDAAVALDPLSGDGVRRALRSGMRAAELVLRHGGGDAVTLRSNDSELERAFGAYWKEQNAFYARERRWSGSPFWARRRPPPR